MERQAGGSGFEASDDEGASDKSDDDDDDDGDFLTVKKVHRFDEPLEEGMELAADASAASKQSKKRKRLKIKLDRITSKVTYDEDGNVVTQDWEDQPATKEDIAQHIQSLKS